MIAAAALFLTAAFSAVEAPKGYAEALSNRYPAWALLNRRSAYALLDIVVRPDGSILRCNVAESFGSDKLVSQACPMVYNIRLTPARGTDGAPVFGRTKLAIKFMTRGGREQQRVLEYKRQADITLARPGAEASENDEFGIAVLVQPDGIVGDCKPAFSELQVAPEQAPAFAGEIVEEACRRALGTKRPRIVEPDGTTVPYVDVLHVRAE